MEISDRNYRKEDQDLGTFLSAGHRTAHRNHNNPDHYGISFHYNGHYYFRQKGVH